MGCICSKFDANDGGAACEKKPAAAAATAAAAFCPGIIPDGSGGGGGGGSGGGGRDDCPNHIVSLTSSTYGVLKLDPDSEKKSSPPAASLIPWRKSVSRDGSPEVIDARELMGDLEDAAEDSEGIRGAGSSSSGKKTGSAVVGVAGTVVEETPERKKLPAAEDSEGASGGGSVSGSSSSSRSSGSKKPVARAGLAGSGLFDTPARKRLLDPSSATSSPKPPLPPTSGGKQRRPPSPRAEADKENATHAEQQPRLSHHHHRNSEPRRPVLRSVENVASPSPRTLLYKKSTATTAVTPSPTPVGLWIQVPPRYKTDSPAPVAASGPALLRQGSFQSKSRRRSLSPLFDPELVASWEKELKREKKEKEKELAEEQIKRMVSWTPKSKRARDAAALLDTFEPLCPPGGEKAVVLYTTTLRGIRKTFEDCNLARARLEAHYVRVLERDISMDSGYREELRELLGGRKVKNKEDEGSGAVPAVVRVPALFVKGRFVGGAEEVVRLEEEGKLELLLEGVPREAGRCCDGCGGLRFVMCAGCYGSCKVYDEEGKVVKCGECNENGLIHCPICC